MEERLTPRKRLSGKAHRHPANCSKKSLTISKSAWTEQQRLPELYIVSEKLP